MFDHQIKLAERNSKIASFGFVFCWIVAVSCLVFPTQIAEIITEISNFVNN